MHEAAARRVVAPYDAEREQKAEMQDRASGHTGRPYGDYFSVGEGLRDVEDAVPYGV